MWDAPKPCGRAGVGAGGVDDVWGGERKIVKGATDTLDAVPFADHVLEERVEVEGDLVARWVRVVYANATLISQALETF